MTRDELPLSILKPANLCASSNSLAKIPLSCNADLVSAAIEVRVPPTSTYPTKQHIDTRPNFSRIPLSRVC